jgi:hypothetical protein
MRKVCLILGLVVVLSASASAQKVIAERAITVAAGSWTTFDYSFDKISDIKGRFRATGGKNDIECYIMDADSFENWKNGNQFSHYYFSGRVTVANFNVRLPAGKYHLIFSNRWSAMTPKAVTIWFFE